MNLDEVLDGYASDALGAMLRVWDAASAKRVVTKADRLRAMRAILSDPAQIGAAQWTEAERTVLAILWRMEPRRLAPLGALCRGHGVEGFDEVLTTLLTCGAILCAEPQWGGKVSIRSIQERDDAAVRIAPGILEAPRLDPPAPLRLAPVPPEHIRETRLGRGPETAAQLLAFVALAGRRKLKVTKAGELSTPAETLIARELGVNATATSWLLTLGIAARMVEVRDGALVPTEGLPIAGLGLGGLLAGLYEGYLARGAWRDDLDLDDPSANAWMGVWRGSSSEGAGLARPVLHGLLRRLDTPGWVRLDDLVDAALVVDPLLGVRAARRPFDERISAPSRPSERLRQREFARGAYVQAAWRLGILDVATTGDAWHRPAQLGRDYEYDRRFRDVALYARAGSESLPRWTAPPCDLCVRVSALGRHILGLEAEAAPPEVVVGLHVGMDFEIVAPIVGTPPTLLFRLDLAARGVPVGPGDAVRRWRLVREPWLAALQGGLDGATLLADLATAVGRPLPENVVATIAGWSSGYGGTTLFAGHDLVEFPDRAARDAVAAEGAGVAIDERWLLVRRGTVKGRVLDYGGMPARVLDVSPDGHVSVDPSGGDLLVGAELDGLTEASRAGPRLTKASLAGRRADHVLIWLRARSRTPMPPGTEVAIRGWCGELPPARTQAVELVQLGDSVVAAAVAEREEIAPYVAGVLAGGLLVLRAGSRARVVKALAGIGIAAQEGLALPSR